MQYGIMQMAQEGEGGIFDDSDVLPTMLVFAVE